MRFYGDVTEILQPDSSISVMGCRERSKIAEGCLVFGIVAG